MKPRCWPCTSTITIRSQARHAGGAAIVVLLLLTAPALSTQLPQKGTLLPSIQFTSPGLAEDRKYLDVKADSFTIQDLHYQVLLVEIINVYCPVCYRQAPLFNELFRRIEKGKLKNKVKMLAVAAGGKVMEVEFLRKDGQYLYPTLHDEAFIIHRRLGEPRTPFTILVDGQGQVLYSHLGVIEDIDAFYDLLERLTE